ncbi:MAG: sensor domain-containing protein, partial [Trebonia sp.]
AQAPFGRRAWAEVRYTLATVPVAIAGVVYTAIMIEHGFLWALSAAGMRKLAAANRHLARELLGEDIAAPPPLGPAPIFKVRTPAGERLAAAVQGTGGKARVWETKPGVTVRGLPPSQITELAAGANIAIDGIEPLNAALNWYNTRVWDRAAWRARAYFALKLPLALTGLAVAAACWAGGAFCLAFPAWWAFVPAFRIVPLGPALSVFPITAAALLVSAPWLLHGVTEADRRLMRGLLGSASPAGRIRVLEESRARAVDDSAARLRGIERDLHDGTQAQLVALAMKLGLAMEKLQGTAPADLPRATQLVGDAHRGALEAITDLRTLARGIHPPVLDNGLADALTTLANRSAVPVELVTDLPERPSAAIETIAYFSAAELLANVAKHSGARHATLEAVHVPGLLRVRVTDDGHGGAQPAAGGGLHGLADRVRTVDGRIAIDSPVGGPTTVTVELPSHA